MKLWRWGVIAALYGVPVVAFSAVGIVVLYRSGRHAWVWWMAPLCWVVAWLLTRLWRKRLAAPAEEPFAAPAHWTARDQEAWRVVESQRRRLEEIAAERLNDPHFYLQSAMDLALAIARHYHPKARDPIGSLTVLDLLAAAQLAIEDSARWCRDTVPGSHLVTVDQWRLLSKAPAWFNVAGNVAWAASFLVNPLNVARYAISRVATQSAMRQLRQHALGQFYVVYLRHVGFYLIEMNSGRLRGGAARYRQLQPRLSAIPGAATAEAPLATADAAGRRRQKATPAEPLEVRIAVVGQVKAGKSSVINALLGHQQAAVDVLPRTKQVQRYELRVAAGRPAPEPSHPLPPGVVASPSERVDTDRLVLLDTVGYADDGATREQLAEMHEALRNADLILLVMNAASPARRADAKLLDEFTAWLQANVRRKLPPVLGVLTHIDRLRPTFDWTPPYQWEKPSRPKEHSIAGTVAYTRGQFDPPLNAVVPVCTDGDGQRMWGVYEQLLPAMLLVLGDARGCAVLRTLHAELDRERIQLLFQQLGHACSTLLRAGLMQLLDLALQDDPSRRPGR